MTKCLFPAILTGFRPLADKSINVTFNVTVPDPNALLVLNALHQQYGYLMFKDSEADKAEIDMFDALEADLSDNGKSPSKRLRNTLYVLFNQDSKGYPDWKAYYSGEMEKFITHLKSKIKD